MPGGRKAAGVSSKGYSVNRGASCSWVDCHKGTLGLLQSFNFHIDRVWMGRWQRLWCCCACKAEFVSIKN
jgi:hypothetical protein